MTAMTSLRRSPWLLTLLGLLLLWGGWFIYRTSFVVDGERTFCLFDDAMISMAYARNVVDGHGLVWTREGGPVEGFTSPLWTFAMIPVNAVGLPPALRALPVQLLSLGLLAAHVVLVGALVRRFFSRGEWSSWLLAPALTASFYPLSYWSLMGMETALQAVLITAAVYRALEITEEGRDRALSVCALLTLAYLTRMDLALMAAVVLAWVALRRGFARRHRRSWLLGGATFAAGTLGYQLFRWLYFGDVLPNTYYLKLTEIPLEVRLLRGLSTYLDFVDANQLVLLIAIAGAVPLLRRRPRLALPLALFGVYSLYSVYVGGDAWEMHVNVRANRFLAIALPQLFVVINALANEALALLDRLPPAAPRRRIRAYALTASVVVLIALADGLWASEQAKANRRAMAVVDRPLLVTSHQQVLTDLRRLETILAPGARVATFWAGVPAFFSDYRMVDMLGYSDRHVARSEPARPLHAANAERYTPGHAKWDFDYVFEHKPPDAFLQVWNLGPKQEPAILEAHGYRRAGGFWVLDGSPWLLPHARR